MSSTKDAAMRFENILFPIDFSASSVDLKADVEWLAKRFKSIVTLLNVFEIPPAWYGMGDAYAPNADWLAGILEQSKKRLDAFTLDLPAAQIRRVVIEGQAAAEIYQRCRTQPVDMIAMATHGHGALEGLLMGSVTAKVLHSVSLPLWLKPGDSPPPPTEGEFKIVCGVDLGVDTLPVLLYARELAQAFHAKVTLVHSVSEAERPNKYLDFDLHKLLKDIAETEIAKAQRQVGTAFDLTVTEYGISTALAVAAEETKANLVLIGRGQTQKFLGRFRTHTYDLLCQVKCPVFSYCPPENAKQAEIRDAV